MLFGMKASTKNTKYAGVEFYAERVRKGSARLAGTVLIVSRSVRNGQCFAAIGVPRDGRKALPVTTWVSPSYLADRCVVVTEEEARAIDAATMNAVDAYERSPEYREMYAVEIRKPGRTPLQPALDRDMGPTKDVAAKFHELYGV